MRALWILLLVVAVSGGPVLAQLSPGFDGEGAEIDDNAGDVAPPPDIAREDGLVEARRARLRGLDTLTNTVHDFEIEVGETLRFRRLIVSLRACRHPSGNAAGEAFAFLQIRDMREEDWRFSGWMLSSSPALSALDHSRYDVWVLSCITS